MNRAKIELAKAKQLEPDDGESEDDFLSRCEDEIGDEDVCQFIWDNASAEGGIQRRVKVSDPVNGEYVMSDETLDRMGEIISSDGWDTSNFNKNPIALFGHRSDFVIGKWKNVRVVKKQLRGTLEFAPEGTSERIDELRKLVQAGILKAVSVGFKSKKKEPLDEKSDPFFGPFKYIKQELMECSLVSIPANPNAMSVAKSLHISPETIGLVFGEQAREDGVVRKGATGEHAVLPKRGTKMSLSQKIAEAERKLVALRDALAKHVESMDETNVSDEQLKTTQELNDQITRSERVLEMMKDSEKHLASSSNDDPPAGRSLTIMRPATTQPEPAKLPSRPFSLPKKQMAPIDLLVKAGVVSIFAHIKKLPPDLIRKQIYGDDENVKAWCDIIQREVELSQKAAVAPAMTTVVGWAAELVQTVYQGLMDTLYPKSIFPRLSSMGLSLTFGRSGKIIIPTRATTPSIAGSFVGEGMPIPVRQGAFTSAQMTPKKMAVITTWTREIDEMSVPAIEGVLRAAIQEDTSISLDSVLIDNNAATAIRPAGLLNGVTPLAPTAGGGFTALVGDIKNVAGALLTATKGNVRSPVWLMNPQQVMSAGLTPAPGVGAFPFQAQVASGNLQGWPIIDSGIVPLGTIIALDAADFVAAGGDAPRFELSDQATLHMEDTAPVDIVSGAAPGTVANPVKSMWQTDSIALRLILPVNWAMRRTGVVQAVNGVTW